MTIFFLVVIYFMLRRPDQFIVGVFTVGCLLVPFMAWFTFLGAAYVVLMFAGILSGALF